MSWHLTYEICNVRLHWKILIHKHFSNMRKVVLSICWSLIQNVNCHNISWALIAPETHLFGGASFDIGEEQSRAQSGTRKALGKKENRPFFSYPNEVSFVQKKKKKIRSLNCAQLNQSTWPFCGLYVKSNWFLKETPSFS